LKLESFDYSTDWANNRSQKKT